MDWENWVQVGQGKWDIVNIEDTLTQKGGCFLPPSFFG
jgi:hypothetical protein